MSKSTCVCRTHDPELLERLDLFDHCDAQFHDCICADHCAGDRLFQSCLSQHHLCVCHFDPHGISDYVHCLADHHECCCVKAKRCKSYMHKFDDQEKTKEIGTLQKLVQEKTTQLKRRQRYILDLEDTVKSLMKENKRCKVDLDLYKSYIKMKSDEFVKNVIA